MCNNAKDKGVLGVNSVWFYSVFNIMQNSQKNYPKQHHT